jgi:hypothetical protein
MTLSKEEFEQWRREPITRLFYEACIERIEEAKEELSNQAGQDQLRDSFNRGFIYAYREMLQFRVEEEDME